MKLCLIIYKIDPLKGSEDATGYHLAARIVRNFPDVTLISRVNNIALLLHDPAFAHVKLVGVDVPPCLSFYKKGGRGIILYYYMWQKYVAKRVKTLDTTQPFDIIHQLNFNTDWAPHFIRPVRGRFIWGPLMHHAMVPWRWFPAGFRRYYCVEILKIMAKFFFWHVNPALRVAIRNASHILFGNPFVPPIIPPSKDTSDGHVVCRQPLATACHNTSAAVMLSSVVRRTFCAVERHASGH